MLPAELLATFTTEANSLALRIQEEKGRSHHHYAIDLEAQLFGATLMMRRILPDSVVDIEQIVAAAKRRAIAAHLAENFRRRVEEALTGRA